MDSLILKSATFRFANIILNEDDEKYGALPAYVDDTKVGNFVTCWELTDEIINELIKTRRLYVHQLTFRGPIYPMILSVECPVKILHPILGNGN